MKLVLILGLCSLSWSSFAQQVPSVTDPSYHAAPGTMGPNAFTGWTWRVDDAKVVTDRILVDVGYRHVKDLHNEWTQTGVARVEIPFKDLASIEFNYLVEKWKLNDEGFQAYQPRTRSGFSVGDVVVGVKFDVLKETAKRPAVALHGSIKTASGGFEDRRFTDSSGYSIDALVAKDILIKTGALKKIRLMAEFGFFCWDDQAHAQNDAERFGVASTFEFARNLKVKLGVQGFNGWEHNGDQPITGYAEVEKSFHPDAAMFASVDLGLTPSANPVTFSAGTHITLLRNYYKRLHDRHREALRRELGIVNH